MDFHLNQIADDQYEMLDENNRRIGLWTETSPGQWVTIEIEGCLSTFARDLGDAFLVSWSELRRLEMQAALSQVKEPCREPWWKRLFGRLARAAGR